MTRRGFLPRGRFFHTLEGGEGGGKTTQSSLLAERLRRAGITVFETREPGGTPRAEAIRQVLLSGKAKRYGAVGEAVLFYAARESHLELAIQPALERGDWVICDRFSDSTRAYQGAAAGVPYPVLETFEQTVVGATKPDLTLIFDIDPELGLRRAAARGTQKDLGPEGDRFETMNLAFHRSLREEFLAIAKAEPDRCVVIDASNNTERVATDVWAAVRAKFKL
jgi:dTMP kinase